MKTQHIALIVAAACFTGAGGYGLYRLGLQQGLDQAATPAASQGVGPQESGRKVLYWHDPMVPGQRFDKPGKSPFMDMQLVPVYADGAANGKGLSISPLVQQNLGIRTAEVTSGTIAQAIEAVGNVAFNERDVALVQARSSGFVERLYVRAPLDPVRKGQKLAEVYMPDWVAAQEEYLAVRRMQGPGSEGLLDGARQRMRLAGMTDDQIRTVTSTGKVQARQVLRSPASGVVSELSARAGMTIAAGSPLFRINGLDTVWINAEVPEALASQLRPGTPVEARAPALGGAVLKGKVSALVPEVSAATRTLKARIEVQNPGHRLVPGMFATVSFTPSARAEVLTVPSEAVIATGKRSVVMVVQENGGFVPVDVETGAEANGRTEIRSGLQAGQKVVVSGQFLIDSEASLRGATTRMAPTSAPAPVTSVHRGEGKVEHIDRQEVTLSHGAIPSMKWPAMTMGFKLAPALVPKGLAVGQAVRFEFKETEEGEYEIVRIESVPGHAGHAAGDPGR